MDSETLETFLEGGEENQHVDFKTSCPWSVDAFAKDILAFSNVKNGGYIIIGIDETEEGFIRSGIKEEDKKTYTIDQMRDQVSAFADPYVNFAYRNVKDAQGLEYGIISVRQFDELPVIAKKENKEIKPGTIYYRTTSKKPESARVCTSYDMREIISTAAINLMRQYNQIATQVNEVKNQNPSLLNDAALKGIDADPIIQRIQKQGYWIFRFYPKTANAQLFNLPQTHDIVEKNTILLRGWDYPHLPNNPKNSGLTVGDDYYQGTVDWQEHIELWRMYQSGQFIHYTSLREDWFACNPWYEGKIPVQPGTALNVIGSLIYQITEFFLFLENILVNTKKYPEGVHVEITLGNTKNRQLWLDENVHRIPLSGVYKAGIENIKYKQDFVSEDILGNSAQTAISVCDYFLQRFGWNHSTSSFEKEQERFIKRQS